MSFNYFQNRLIRPEESTLTEIEKTIINDILDKINTALSGHFFNHHKIQFILAGYTSSIEIVDSNTTIKLSQIQINCIKNALEESGWYVNIIDKKFAHDFNIELSTDSTNHQTKIIKISKINGVH